MTRVLRYATQLSWAGKNAARFTCSARDMDFHCTFSPGFSGPNATSKSALAPVAPGFGEGPEWSQSWMNGPEPAGLPRRTHARLMISGVLQWANTLVAVSLASFRSEARRVGKEC